MVTVGTTESEEPAPLPLTKPALRPQRPFFPAGARCRARGRLGGARCRVTRDGVVRRPGTLPRPSARGRTTAALRDLDLVPCFRRSCRRDAGVGRAGAPRGTRTSRAGGFFRLLRMGRDFGSVTAWPSRRHARRGLGCRRRDSWWSVGPGP